jgi:hypothetical protein
MSDYRNNVKKVQWTLVKTFEDPQYGIVVSVNQSDQYRPRYSYEIGYRPKSVGQEGYARRQLPLMATGQGKIKIESLGNAITRLTSEAELWVEARCQAREDEIIAEKIARERNDLERGKPKQKPGLKKLAYLTGETAMKRAKLQEKSNEQTDVQVTTQEGSSAAGEAVGGSEAAGASETDG